MRHSPPGDSLQHSPAPPQTSDNTAASTSAPSHTLSPTGKSATSATSKTAEESSVPIAPGTLDDGDCQTYTVWTEIAEDDQYANSCEYIADLVGSTVEEFLEWNPSLKEVTPCELQKGYRYCILSWDCKLVLKSRIVFHR